MQSGHGHTGKDHFPPPLNIIIITKDITIIGAGPVIIKINIPNVITLDGGVVQGNIWHKVNGQTPTLYTLELGEKSKIKTKTCTLGF